MVDTIVWKDPPKKVAPEKEGKWFRILTIVRSRPGESACICTKSTPAAAAALAHYLNSGKTRLPEGRFSILSRGCEVYAKYLEGGTTTETTQGAEEVAV